MGNFTDDIISRVWEKATAVSNNDPNIWRQDYAGAWIRRDHYGKESPYGWEIDHLKPVSLGGTDSMDNLYPLQWQNNRTKANNYPMFSTSVTSGGVSNIEMLKSWEAK